MNSQISEYLVEVLQKKYNFELKDIKLENPPKSDMGDLAFGCFMLARDLRKSPNQIAEDLKSYIESDNSIHKSIKKVEVAGPYLNFFLKNDTYLSDFISMMQSEALYQNLSPEKSENIYIDYIGANVGKPLHIGHMCTPSHGQVFINLFKKLGYNVISDSHIGDWGIIFGKLIVAYKKYGDQELLSKNAVEHLFNLYVKISTDAEEDSKLEQDFRDAFKLLSEGNKLSVDLWKEFTSNSIKSMNLQLSRIFVNPKYNIGESFYEGVGLPKIENYPDLKYSMKDIVKELLEKNIATKNEDGSVGVVFPEEMKIPSCILQKRDGTHGYLASDLASVKYRVDNWNPSKILYFVDVRQQLHLKQTFEISKLAGWIDASTEISHAHNGFISLKDGAMSTRKGKIIKLEDLLDESGERAKKIITEKRNDLSTKELNEISKIVGIGAIKYGYLKKSREADVIFDWDEFMSFEGNSGPYIQYAYVRAKKILDSSTDKITYDNISFDSDEEKELLKHILAFEKAISNTKEDYHAHVLCKYTYELTKKFSSFYNNIQILGESDKNVRISRLLLLSGFIKILNECFDILGIPLPNQM